VLKHPTLDQLHTLGLYGMAKAFADLAAADQAKDIAHADWLALLLDRETSWRRDKRLTARLRAAKLRQQASVEDVAERTVKVLKRCVPGAVPGIAFLSGGQSDEEATAHLNAMNAANPNLPWALTFSYGRALQAAPQKAWSGKVDNVKAAQAAFEHRANMNGLAAQGKWKKELEKA